MGSLPGRNCIRPVRLRGRSVKRLHRNLIAAVSVSVLSNGLRSVRSAHGPFRNGRLCPHSIASQMGLPGERLFLVFSFDPYLNAALCIDRINLGSQPKEITILWSCLGPEYLVPGIGRPARRRVLAAADFAPQDLAQ